MNKKAAAHPAGKAGSGAAGSEDVHNITDARTGHTDDMHQRMVKYALAMGIRLVCLLLIFVLDGWLKLIAVAGAVVIANGGSDTVNEHSAALLDSAPLAELEGRPGADPHNGSSGSGSGSGSYSSAAATVPGEVVDDDAAGARGGATRLPEDDDRASSPDDDASSPDGGGGAAPDGHHDGGAVRSDTERGRQPGNGDGTS
jgi:hypothetical protein